MRTPFVPPLVSVIIPAYNAERFIEQALASVICQTYRDIEVLVVDDGSQDLTADIINSICLKDPRVLFFQQAQSGVAAARNTAIQHSKGQYIAPIDADDVWHPQHLEKLVTCMFHAGPSVGLVYAWSIVMDEQGQLTRDFLVSPIEGKVYETLLTYNFLGNASTCLIRRDCLREVGYYNSGFFQHHSQGCEDWDLYLRIAQKYEFRVVPEFLIGYRRVKRGMSGNYQGMATSHSLMLGAIQQENDSISAYIYRLSLVNFYLHLAHESCRADRTKGSFYWLGQAFRAGLLTTLFSYRLYSLLVKEILIGITKALRLCKPSSGYVHPANHWKDDLHHTLFENPDFDRKRFSIKIKLLIQKCTHYLIKSCFSRSGTIRPFILKDPLTHSGRKQPPLQK